METSQQYPSTAKTVTYDVASQKLILHPSYPVPTPNPEKDEHLIRVHTIALCKGELDWPALHPWYIFADNPEKVVIPGYDVAGTVVTVPADSKFKPGDEVIARTKTDRPGNYREYSTAKGVELAKKPSNLSWAEAASIPVSAITAWQALFDHAGVDGFEDPGSKRKKILVIAAAGSVGIWLVQLAKMAGLHVIAQVGSAENEELVKKLGAAETINYHTTSLKEWVEGNEPVDMVFDNLGGKTLGEAWYCVKDGGALVSIVDDPEGMRPKELARRDVKSTFFILDPDCRQLEKISEFANEGRCVTMVDSVWGFDDYEKAFAKLRAGKVRGKIVIDVTK